MTSDSVVRGVQGQDFSDFVGRKAELTRLREMIGAHRYVLVTGLSGIGKTRLVDRLLESLSRTYRDGVIRVDASAITGRAALMATLASRLRSENPSEAAVRTSISSFSGLLVVDAADDPALELADVLEGFADVSETARFMVVSTSRTGIVGEAVFVVPPLSLPAEMEDRWLDEHEIHAADAVRMLISRLQDETREFSTSKDALIDLVDLARAVDGVPRRIEAVARALRVLSPAELLTALEDSSFDLEQFLPRGRAGARTERLFRRSAKELGPEEAKLLSALTWFRSEFDISMVSRIFASGGFASVSAIIARLVDHSLVVRTVGSAGEPVFRILEPYRNLARSLCDDDESAENQALLRSHLLASLEDAQARWFSEEQLRVARHTRRYSLDIRGAIEALLETGRSEDVIDLVWRLRFFLHTRIVGSWTEVRDWLSRAQAQVSLSDLSRVSGQLLLSYFDFLDGDIDGSEAHFLSSRSIASERSSVPGLERLDLLVSALVDIGRDRLTEATTKLEELSERTFPGPESASNELNWFLSLVLFAQGELERARQVLVSSMRREEIAGDSFGFDNSTWLLASIELQAGDLDQASMLLNRALASFIQFEHAPGQAICLQLMAALAQQRGDRTTYDQITKTGILGVAVYPSMPEWLPNDAPASQVDVARNPPRALGRHPLPIATLMIVDGRTSVTAASDHHSNRAILSEREWEIADLISQGLSNQAIAARLVISRRTVEGHVQRVLGKLGFRSRSQIAVWVSEFNAAESPEALR
ncbi:LuxR C-terminal-related transcriptional regulator [Herbiconiux ginsengi]|uniref:AAA ATPase domain-containing protein n=1 Tax=Herbiconiux ginsengi TaxID=381665 RepID=A0A1H3LPU9_9MICO|nr:LuxR C-terminal-related transcriptional regulator [Herbiconiux ginsengi]SDY65875.1 AAA ATPase domain-containing protein [Herbiconiux ginsengi]